MNRVRLDYQRKEAPLPRLGLLVLIVGIGAAIAVGDYYMTLARQIASWEAYGDQMENTAHRRGILVHKDERNRDYGEDIRRANAVLRQLTLPWDQLFDTIESVGNKDVALLALTPDPEKRLIRIGIEAKNATAGLNYLRSLEDHEVFQNVQLQSHQIQLQDPERPIRFTLQAAWKGLP